jgi:hypothetical protein
MYFIEKYAVYSHGVFWVGNDIDEAKAECDRLASIDVDSHHTYGVFEFGILNKDKMPNGEVGCKWCSFNHDPLHREVYKARKAENL